MRRWKMPPMATDESRPALLAASLEGASAMLRTMRERLPQIQAIADVLIATLRAGGKIMACGNGGSAAEALHLAEELVGRFQQPRRALPGLCLAADPRSEEEPS